MQILIHDPPPEKKQTEGMKNALHVWTEIPAQTKSDPRVKADETVISDSERERAERFHFEADYLAYVAAHALLRSALSLFSPVPPQDWRFERGPHGRPFVAREMNPTDIRFNISHTRTLVACAVARGFDCGIDVETIGRSRDPLSLAKYNFAHSEYRALKALRGAALDEHFTALWCLKEAYLKAEGVGLTAPLNRISFDIDSTPDGSIGYHLRDTDDQPAWRFRLFRPTKTHFGALAFKAR